MRSRPQRLQPLQRDREVAAIGYCNECYGIIVNKTLLSRLATHSTRTQTRIPQSSREDIHARAAELGFDAFTSAGLDGSSSWRFSATLPTCRCFYEFRDVRRDRAARDHHRQVHGKLQEHLGSLHQHLRDRTLPARNRDGDQAEAEFGEGKACSIRTVPGNTATSRQVRDEPDSSR
jgi:raffinose/stachyose/melibiose transport system substrate-binding protein